MFWLFFCVFSPPVLAPRQPDPQSSCEPVRHVVSGRCGLCLCVRDMMDFNDSCFIDYSVFSELCMLSECDFNDAKNSKRRLDKVKPIPKSLSECNNVQKRIVLYYKIFKYVWPEICIRQAIPRCIVGRVRILFPGDIEGSQRFVDRVFD